MWTEERILALGTRKLLTLIENCHKAIEKQDKNAADAQDILSIVTATGRLKASHENPVGLPINDPKVLEMELILTREDVREKMMEASRKGRPALEPIDSVFHAELGDWYGDRYHSTQTAGGLVGEAMRELGYEKSGAKALDASCRAKTASVFIKKIY